eukprot:Partr_v1_DN28924_c1_g1_i4_m26045 putative Rhomboid 5 homolog
MDNLNFTAAPLVSLTSDRPKPPRIKKDTPALPTLSCESINESAAISNLDPAVDDLINSNSAVDSTKLESQTAPRVASSRPKVVDLPPRSPTNLLPLMAPLPLKESVGSDIDDTSTQLNSIFASVLADIGHNNEAFQVPPGPGRIKPNHRHNDRSEVSTPSKNDPQEVPLASEKETLESKGELTLNATNSNLPDSTKPLTLTRDQDPPAILRANKELPTIPRDNNPRLPSAKSHAASESNLHAGHVIRSPATITTGVSPASERNKAAHVHSEATLPPPVPNDTKGRRHEVASSPDIEKASKIDQQTLEKRSNRKSQIFSSPADHGRNAPVTAFTTIDFDNEFVDNSSEFDYYSYDSLSDSDLNLTPDFEYYTDSEDEQFRDFLKSWDRRKEPSTQVKITGATSPRLKQKRIKQFARKEDDPKTLERSTVNSIPSAGPERATAKPGNMEEDFFKIRASAVLHSGKKGRARKRGKKGLNNQTSTPIKSGQNDTVGPRRRKLSMEDNVADQQAPVHDQEEFVDLINGAVVSRRKENLPKSLRDPRVRRQIMEMKIYKPYFTYGSIIVNGIMMLAQFINSQISTGILFQTKPMNYMLGPPSETLVRMGGRFLPCMKSGYEDRGFNCSIFINYRTNSNSASLTASLSSASVFSNGTNAVEEVQRPRSFFQNGVMMSLNSTDLAPVGACTMEQFCGGPPNQWWRSLTSMLLHGGLVHFLSNSLFMYQIGCALEEVHGHWRIATSYIVSGFGGFLFGAHFSPFVVVVGASGSIYGILALTLVDLLFNFRLVIRPWKEVAKLMCMIFVYLAIGYLPFIDNFAHVGGFLIGILSGLMLLKPITFSTADAATKTFLKIASFPLLLFVMIYLVITFYQDTNSCTWCKYVNCLPINGGCSAYD